MRFVTERNILASMRRVGDYGSSMHGLNMHLGRYDELDFLDVLGDPYNKPDVDKEGPHARMEKHYGINAWYNSFNLSIRSFFISKKGL